MVLTSRYWAAVALAAGLAGWSVLVGQPVVLLGAAGVCAWLLASQYAFVAALDRVDDELAVEQATARSRVPTGTGLGVRLAAALPAPAPVRLDVEAAPPVAAVGSTRQERTLAVPVGETTAETAFDVEVRFAGRYRFGTPTVTARDDRGLFRAVLATGTRPELTVEPRAAVDENRLTSVYGEHRANAWGRGIELAEVREYLPGDSADHIDWKATARLGHPHIREFEAETDRKTALIVDHRAPMHAGPPGETKLDYARQAALQVAETVRANDEPLGLYAVGDEGLTARLHPDASPRRYASVRTFLHDLRPTTTGAGDRSRPGGTRTPGEAQRALHALGADDSAFARRLRPFFGAARRYVQRIEDDPLFVTVRAHLARTSGSTATTIVTDDTDRSEVREAVKAARRAGDSVFVCLAPTALFAPADRIDPAERGERYADFATFRDDLARLDRVTVFETGPARADRRDAPDGPPRNRERGVPLR